MALSYGSVKPLVSVTFGSGERNGVASMAASEVGCVLSGLAQGSDKFCCASTWGARQIDEARARSITWRATYGTDGSSTRRFSGRSTVRSEQRKALIARGSPGGERLDSPDFSS